MSKALYDCLIVGGGPAGLATATGLARLQHSSLVLDSGVYRNAKAKHMHNVLGWDHADPAEYRAKARQDLLSRYAGVVTFQTATIDHVRKLDSGRFEAVDESGNVYTGKKLCLAAGVRDVMPDIPGYTDCWTKGIFHCLFCHGYEERGKSSAGLLAMPMISEPFMALHMGKMALQLADKLTIYTNGDSAMTAKMREALVKPDSRITLESRKIARLGMKSIDTSDVVVTFEDGSSITEGFIVHPPTVEIKTLPPFNQTSLEGVFACGDSATMMRAVPTATAMGGVAAAGIAAQVEAEK